MLLQEMNHRNQDVRLGITFRAEYVHKTFARYIKPLGEFLETDHRIDIVA